VHVGEVVRATGSTDVGPYHEHRARRPPEVDGVDGDEPVHRVEQLLDEVDAADADLEDAHPRRRRTLEQARGDGDAEPVVAAKDVSDTGDEDAHGARIGGVETTAPIDELRRRLSRYAPDRFPVQHATAQFHLGVALANAGRLDAAEAALAAAAHLFEPERLRAEHAKVLVALGAVRRLRGALPAAEAAFARAEALFAAGGETLEEGAARFNRGLVERDLGRPEQAAEHFERARRLLPAESAPAQAGAAARELGATLLLLGRPDEAEGLLEEARALADRTRDSTAFGEAANVLGLVRLALDRPAEAAVAFREAAASHPRSVRPGPYSMAKANAALAYERMGDVVRSRLTARQALGAADVPLPVRDQAEAVLARLPPGRGDILRVLDREPHDARETALREELARWADADDVERREETAAWIAGQLEHEDGGELAATWLGALLELPPAGFEAVVRSTVEALRDEALDTARFRAQLDAASARYYSPQLLRVRDAFARVAAETGLGAAWS
jgi:tetratricopeptide (TPR) repeat protein